MPSVKVKYLAPICDIAGTYRETLSLDDGATTMDLIGTICRKYGKPVVELFYDAEREFRPMFIILRNTRPMERFELDEPLEEGDRVVFVPPIAGG
jgi:MoaD family protein